MNLTSGNVKINKCVEVLHWTKDEMGHGFFGEFKWRTTHDVSLFPRIRSGLCWGLPRNEKDTDLREKAGRDEFHDPRGYGS